MTTHISVLPLPTGLEQELSFSKASANGDSQQIAPKFRFYRENIRLCGILEEILSKVYQPWMNRTASDLALTASGNGSSYFSLDTIVALHRKLSDFENSVHETFSWKKGDVVVQAQHKVLFENQKLMLHARYVSAYILPSSYVCHHI